MKYSLLPVVRTCFKAMTFKNKFKIQLMPLTTCNQIDDNFTKMIPVSETIIKDKLKTFSVPFTDGFTCFHVKDCNLCSKEKTAENSNNPDIFINKKTGFFLCEHCKATGSWSTFNGLLNKLKTSNFEEVASLKNECAKYDKNSYNWSEISNNTSLLTELNDEAYKKVFKKFQLIFCSKQTVNNLHIRINKEHNMLYFPLICSSGSNVVGYKTLDLNGSSNTLPRTDCPGYFVKSNEKKSVVIVGQISDFFALLSQEIPYQILCLPYGSANLPQSTLPFLENYSKIILWLGSSGALDSTGNFAKKLNNKRCFVVRPTENQASPVTALLRNQNLKNILEDAKPTWHECITTFNSLREEVLSELQNNHMILGVPWKRFPALNKILKGHRRGELTVITGPTGAGKTTFISEYSLDLAMQGVNTLWGSFEIKNSRLARIMLQQFVGGPLTDNVIEFNTIADKFEQLPIFFMTFHGQQKISNVMDAVEHCSYTYDIAHVIIDNVQFMIEVSSDGYQIDRFWKQDFLIQSFRSFASTNNCHVTLVMHPRKGMDGADLSINSIFGGAKAAQEADNIFIIQNKKLSASEGKKFLQISKNRFSGDLGAVPLNFNKSSLCFSDKNLNLNKQKSKEEKQSQFN